MLRRSFFFRYLSPYAGKILLNVLLRALSAVFTVVLLMGITPLLSVLFGQESSMGTSFDPKEGWTQKLQSLVGLSVQENGTTLTLAYIAISILVLYFLKNLSGYLALFYFSPIRNGALAKLRHDLYERLLILPLSFYGSHRKGDLMTRLSSDLVEIDENILRQFQQVLTDILLFVCMLTSLFVISTPLTIAVLFLIPVAGGLTAFFSRSLRRRSSQLQALTGELTAHTEESLQGLKTIKSFNTQTYSLQNYQKINQKMNRVRIRTQRRQDLSSPLSEFISTICIAVLLIFGGYLVLQEANLSASSLITFLITFGLVVTPAKNISTAYYGVQRGKASVKRLKDILYAEEKIVEKPDALSIKDFKDNIEFKNVSFCYSDGNTQVLDHLNLKIQKGRFIALVGASGAGKSTLVDLIPRFYDVTEGEVLWDGSPIENLKIDDLRALSALVSQETVLFHDTVAQNIGLGIKNVTREDIIEAAKAANADEFIRELSQGYDTLIGDSGIKLSGGQRQRLSIARALAKKSPVLILDEATSALDSVSEAKVQEAIERISKNKTIIAIAHRLSTIRKADEIIVLEKGKIVERGTHEELCSQQGIYYRLYGLS